MQQSIYDFLFVSGLVMYKLGPLLETFAINLTNKQTNKCKFFTVCPSQLLLALGLATTYYSEK
jgi:hypothetical protein